MLLSNANRKHLPNSQLTYHFSAAEKMVPDKLFNFSSILLSEKAADLLVNGGVKVESAVKEKL